MQPRFRLSTLLLAIGVLATLLAFWRLKPQGGPLEIIPYELPVLVLGIILATLLAMVLSVRQ